MIESEKEVLQAIRNLVSDIGYDFFDRGSPYPPRGHEKALYLAAQPRKGDNRKLLHFVVTIESNRFRITLGGAKAPQYRKDLNQLLDFIKDWLLTR
jgi:hypothetical protein